LVPWALANVPLESLGFGGWVRSLACAALALLAPAAGAAALMRGTSVPAFVRVLGRSEDRPRDPLALALGLLLIFAAILSVQVALGMVFNPRYLDFPFAPLTAGVVPFVTLTLLLPREAGARAASETAIAAVLAASAIYIALNETIENWQALWLCAVLIALAFSLSRARDVRD
jgi:glucan 1,3-beta-glucosidase